MQTILKRVPEKPFTIAIFSILFLVMVWAVFTFLREPLEQPWYPGNRNFLIGVDWKGALLPGVKALISNKSPYAVGVYNPPWVLLPFIPLAIFPQTISTAAMFVLGLFMPAWAAARMGAKPMIAAGFALSPFCLLNAQNCNIDWLVLLGFTLPPQIGLFLVLAKPQIGFAVTLFWLVEAWRNGKMREVLRIFGPITIVFLLSLALYGLWPLIYLAKPSIDPSNDSPFPMLVPIGLVLLLYGLRKRRMLPAAMSAPFLSPYLIAHSWAVALFGLTRSQVEFWAVWVMLWIMRLGLHVL